MGRKGRFSAVEIATLAASLVLLMTMAVPTYESHTVRVHRDAAQDFLRQAGVRQQEHFQRQGRYAPSLEALGLTVPADLQRRYRFRLAVDPSQGSGVVLSAHPRAGSPQQGDPVLRVRARPSPAAEPTVVQHTP